MRKATAINGVIWITGFSSAGKTTLSRKVDRLLRKQQISTVFLDGDDLRNIFGDHWGFDKASRVELAKIYMRLCSHLSSQGHVVIISAIAMFDETVEWMRLNIPNAMQVYLDVPLQERAERDRRTKNIFGSRNFDDTIYDIPRSADLVIRNFGSVTIGQSAESVVTRFFDLLGSNKDRGRKSHWDTYYQQHEAPTTPSSYAQDVLASLKPGMSILEIGSGNGRDAAYFARNGMQVTAIDRSEAAVTLCRTHYRDVSASFFSGTLADTKQQFEQTKFDAVFSRFVLHAMPLSEEIETLNVCSQIMKPGARLYIECRSINDPLARKGEILSQTERVAGHYRRFIILDELKDRLFQAGFRVVDAIESDGLSALGNDDPVVIRVTAERVTGLEQLVKTTIRDDADVPVLMP
jgi:bifunctional enzyme CysN/CysC